MLSNTALRLFELNKDFYSESAAEFSASRKGFWPGWDRFWDFLEQQEFLPERVLDLGCGNGRLAGFLQTKLLDFKYLGLDFSKKLLADAKKKYAGKEFEFSAHDFRTKFKLKQKYDLIAAIALLHHIPGFDNRLRLLENAAEHLSGYLIFTTWNFMSDLKLSTKVVSWQEAGISETELESGDLLLNWGSSNSHLRYCHNFSEAELGQLVTGSGLKIVKQFDSDGRNQRLNTYYVCQRI
jgi:SAM-dependent methyltransferase